MLLRQIYDDSLAQAAYLIGCQKTGEAIVIDPERDVDRYMKAAQKEGLRITAVAETHIHADFLSGARELAEKTGAKAYLSGEGGPEWSYQWLNSKKGGGSYPHQLLKHGDSFRVGNIEFKALHTPGHTPEHISFLVTDRGGGATLPMGIVTGDFVFVGDLGRPDLLETAVGKLGSSEPAAKALFRSVQELLKQPEWLQLWPAHGAGSACGKALGAVPQTTLGYEKRFSPAFQSAKDEPTFVHFILEGQPEPPLYFARMKRDNRAGPAVLGELPAPRLLSAAELGEIDSRRTAVVDTRTWDAFRKGHIPGALFHPINSSFPTDAGSMVDENEPISLIVESDRVEEAVRMLVRVGLDRVESYADAVTLEKYRAAGGKLATTDDLPAPEVASRLAQPSAFLLDVRRHSEFDAGHIDGATLIPHTRLRAHLGELPRDRHYYVLCRSGSRSARAAALLERHGFNATNLSGGFLAWEKAQGMVGAKGP